MTLNLRATLAAAIITASFGSDASAASFNCFDAHKPAEVMICQDETLSAVDQINAAIYYGLSNGVALRYRPRLAQYEREWLTTRNACGYDRQCLLTSYQFHITYLCATADASGVGLDLCEDGDQPE